MFTRNRNLRETKGRMRPRGRAYCPRGATPSKCLNVVYAASLAIYKTLSSSASGVVFCIVYVSKVSLGHLT